MSVKITLVVMVTLALVAFSGCLNNPQSSSEDNTVTYLADNPEGAADVTDDNPGHVVVYFFWGDGCPHCAHEKPFLEEMQQKYPMIEIKMFETWKNPDNAQLFSDVAKAYGTTAQGVPTTFIGDKYWVGYADYMGEEMEAKITSCIDNGCINPEDMLN